MAGGNYGGNSLPTTPVAGAALITGAFTTYKDYKCTSAVGGTRFTYKSTNVDMSGGTVNMVMTPRDITAQTGGVVFLCYECSCSSPMTGTTAPSSFYSGTTDEFIRPQMFQPTIIGGGGVNN
jgi:hypothetical protein|tara:strand:+ start:6277 stop:6642 length:366 start_codon:yes stop_codon:yes gene_type:complete